MSNAVINADPSNSFPKTQNSQENLIQEVISQADSQQNTTPVTSSQQSILSKAIGNPENLPSVLVDVPSKPNFKEPSLPIIGFNLSRFVLYIIAGFIILLIVFLFVKEFDATPSINIPTEANISDSAYTRKIELAKLIQEEKKRYRDFTIQITQMILLNLLLPVLTAILGYIFASNKNKEI